MVHRQMNNSKNLKFRLAKKTASAFVDFKILFKQKIIATEASEGCLVVKFIRQ